MELSVQHGCKPPVPPSLSKKKTVTRKPWRTAPATGVIMASYGWRVSGVGGNVRDWGAGGKEWADV